MAIGTYFEVELQEATSSYPLRWDLADNQVIEYASTINDLMEYSMGSDHGDLSLNLMHFMGYDVKDVQSHVDKEGNVDMFASIGDGESETNDSRAYVVFEADDFKFELPLTEYMPEADLKPLVPELIASVQYEILSPLCSMTAKARRGEFESMTDDAFNALQDAVDKLNMAWGDRRSMPWLEFAAHCAFMLDLNDNDLEKSLYAMYGGRPMKHLCGRPVVDIDFLVNKYKKGDK